MKLDAAWLSWPEIKTLGNAFAQAGFELRFVGGCVRDTILNRDIHEFDAATDANPGQMLALLEKAGLRAIPTGIDHGTVTALVGSRSFEVTTLRKDVATDGRHAEVAFGTSWEDDARRRDFTMNALYLSTDGMLHDYVGGLDDCKAQRVKFIGDAGQRIREDYLRILRYFRFVATVGNNQFDSAALAACAANKEGIAQLSGERIAAELLKLLAANETHAAMEKLLPLLPPPLSFPPSAGLKKLDMLAAPALLKLAALIGDAASIPTIAARLKLSSKQVKSLELWLTHYKNISPGMAVLEQQKLVRKLGGDYLSVLQLAYALSDKDWKTYAPLAAMNDWVPPAFPVAAKDLMALGYSEGKPLGDALKMLEKIWEDGGYRLAREELLTQLPR